MLFSLLNERETRENGQDRQADPLGTDNALSLSLSLSYKLTYTPLTRATPIMRGQTDPGIAPADTGFLLVDDTVYQIGASLKDLGKKLFAFSKMEAKSAAILKNVEVTQTNQKVITP